MRDFLFGLNLLLVVQIHAQHLPAYVVYAHDSIEVTYGEMLDSLTSTDMVLFGEMHNDPISHWLEQELYLDLKNVSDVVVGMEMFETDQQIHVDSFMTDSVEIPEAMQWSNFKTDYLPLLELARTDSTPVIATNIPRRYAMVVFRGGFGALDTLSQEESRWIAPLPIAYDPTLPNYEAMLYMFDDDHAHENLPKAQAIKDATMAHNILKNWEKGQLFYHLNGSYHSNNKEGICWYLLNEDPQLRIKTICVVSQEEITTVDEENKGKADYIICVPSRMTKTY